MKDLANLSVGGVAVRQKGVLYCLNDLHVAAGGDKKHQPSNFLRVEQTQALISEIDKSSDMRISHEVVRGTKGGTFVCKELVYAYAMWISPKFHLAVIRAYDALVNGEIEKAKDIATRTILKDEYRPMTERDNLTPDGKKAMLALQRANTALLDLDMDYQERKDKLGDILKNRFTGRVLIEAGTECQRLAA